MTNLKQTGVAATATPTDSTGNAGHTQEKSITPGPLAVKMLLEGRKVSYLGSLAEPYRSIAQYVTEHRNGKTGGDILGDAIKLYAAGDRKAILQAVTNAQPIGDSDPQSNEAEPLPTGNDMPSLPDDAALPDRLLNNLDSSGQWLTTYIDFACKAAPMSPREYHEVLGLTLLSAAIARRVVLYASTDEIYPNLYALLVGPSTIIKKSTAFRIAHKVLSKAELRRLRLSDSVTPESLIDELTGELPGNFEKLEDTDREEIERGRVFAGQRAWLMEEASSLFDAFGREHLAALRNFVLDLYDCPDRRDFSTRGSGLRIIKRAYLTICGPSTYAAMKRHFKNPLYWEDGVFSRFVFATPVSLPTQYIFYPDRLEVPNDLAESLRVLALDKLPLPEKASNKAIEPLTVALSDGVWERWRAYGQALEFDLLKTNQVPPQLHPNYGRLKMSAMKAALCLATIDWAMSNTRKPPTVTLRHWARAQVIAESWRASLHRLQFTVERNSSEDFYETISRKLSPTLVRTQREIGQALNKTSPQEYAELERSLQQMERMGIVVRAKRKGKRGREAEGWLLAEG